MIAAACLRAAWTPQDVRDFTNIMRPPNSLWIIESMRYDRKQWVCLCDRVCVGVHVRACTCA